MLLLKLRHLAMLLLEVFAHLIILHEAMHFRINARRRWLHVLRQMGRIDLRRLAIKITEQMRVHLVWIGGRVRIGRRAGLCSHIVNLASECVAVAHLVPDTSAKREFSRSVAARPTVTVSFSGALPPWSSMY